MIKRIELSDFNGDYDLCWRVANAIASNDPSVLVVVAAYGWRGAEFFGNGCRFEEVRFEPFVPKPPAPPEPAPRWVTENGTATITNASPLTAAHLGVS